MTIYPSIIESKNDYLYAANLKYAHDDADEFMINDEVKNNIKCRLIYSDYETLMLNNYDNKKNMRRSLRRGETYRYGVIFYDNKGRSSSVCPVTHLVSDWSDTGSRLINGDITVPAFNPSQDI